METMKHKIIFLIARQLGIETLTGTIKDGKYDIEAVFTHYYEPDMKTKRPLFSEYVDICEKHSIPLIVVHKNPKNLAILKRINYDFMIADCWKYIIPEEYLVCANIASLNMHRSLLPKYKGLKPIKRMLMNGEREAGLTVYEMTEDIDSGRIIYQKKVVMEPGDTEDTIFEKLYPYQYENMKAAIEKYLSENKWSV